MEIKLTESEQNRFWAKAERHKGGCLQWTGATNGKPSGGIEYGLFKIPKTRKNITAHRLSYILANGGIPDGMFVCHKCDNPVCIEPSHLFVGTPKDNVADMDLKNRRVVKPCRGMDNGRAKLTDSDVSRIREMRQSMTISSIAAVFGMGTSQIQRIVTNKVRAA